MTVTGQMRPCEHPGCTRPSFYYSSPRGGRWTYLCREHFRELLRRRVAAYRGWSRRRLIQEAQRNRALARARAMEFTA